VISIIGAVVVFWTVTPKFETSVGSCEAACDSLSWLRIRSVFGSVFTSKSTISRISPVEELTEYR
jgi:hypothetical protein